MPAFIAWQPLVGRKVSCEGFCSCVVYAMPSLVLRVKETEEGLQRIGVCVCVLVQKSFGLGSNRQRMLIMQPIQTSWPPFEDPFGMFC